MTTRELIDAVRALQLGQVLRVPLGANRRARAQSRRQVLSIAGYALGRRHRTRELSSGVLLIERTA